MQCFFKAASCSIQCPDNIIISGLCPLFYYALKDYQPAPTERVRFKERDEKINKGPMKHPLSDDFHELKTAKQARVSSQKSSNKWHMSPKGGGSGQEREREGDPSTESKSCDLQVAFSSPPHESKRGRKRSLSGSSVSDDSLSPPLVKVNHR